MENKKLTALLFANNKRGDVTNEFFTQSVNIASARIQLMPALRSAQGLGLEINIHSLHCSQPSDLNLINSSKICIIGKMMATDQTSADSMIMANLAAITRLKSLGSKIIVLYCDNLLVHEGSINKFFADIFYLADYIVYPSKLLYKLSKKYHNSSCKHSIIYDPWQLANWHEPKTLKTEETCRLIWFGSNKNAKYLLSALEPLIVNSNQKRNFELTILSTPSIHEKVKNIFLRSPHLGPNWTIRLVTWDTNHQPFQLESELSRSHISVIPSDPKDPMKAGVSHNRLVDSIRGGCVTIASPMNSYKELSELALLGNDMSELLENALTNYHLICQKITQYRYKSLERYSPKNNEEEWEKFFMQVLNT